MSSNGLQLSLKHCTYSPVCMCTSLFWLLTVFQAAWNCQTLHSTPLCLLPFFQSSQLQYQPLCNSKFWCSWKYDTKATLPAREQREMMVGGINTPSQSVCLFTCSPGNCTGQLCTLFPFQTKSCLLFPRGHIEQKCCVLSVFPSIWARGEEKEAHSLTLNVSD